MKNRVLTTAKFEIVEERLVIKPWVIASNVEHKKNFQGVSNIPINGGAIHATRNVQRAVSIPHAKRQMVTAKAG